LWQFISDLGMKNSFKDLGVDEKAYFNKLPKFIESSERAVATKLSPKIPSYQEAEKIFSDSYYGYKPNKLFAD